MLTIFNEMLTQYWEEKGKANSTEIDSYAQGKHSVWKSIKMSHLKFKSKIYSFQIKKNQNFALHSWFLYAWNCKFLHLKNLTRLFGWLSYIVCKPFLSTALSCSLGNKVIKKRDRRAPYRQAQNNEAAKNKLKIIQLKDTNLVLVSVRLRSQLRLKSQWSSSLASSKATNGGKQPHWIDDL